MSMSIDGLANRLANNYFKLTADSRGYKYWDYLRWLEKEVDKEFQKAIPNYTNVVITKPKGTLYFGKPNLEQYRNMPRIIGKACADYWAQTINPDGQPVSCNKIKSVTNDAAKIATPIEQQLIALHTNTLRQPYFHDFCAVLINNVKTIIWTVEESDSTCNSTFQVQVT